jgi:hypothetical protein
MNTRNFRLALLIAFLAVAGLLIVGLHRSGDLAILRLALFGVIAFGTTVTYAYPVAGATPPVFPNRGSMVNVQVNFGTADTDAILLHNFNLTAAQLAAQQPLIFFYNAAGGSGTVDAQFTLVNTDANTVTILKGATGAGTERIINVTMLRPNSLIG